MRSGRVLAVLAIVVLLVGLVPAVSAGAQSIAPGGSSSRQIPAGGTTSIRSGPEGLDGPQQPELRPGSAADEGAGSFNRPRPGFKNGKFPKKPLDAPTVPSSAVAGSNSELGLSFDGLNHRDQRLANGGNQWTLEPPDQGLCVGNGYVVETVNSVIRVWNTSGSALTGVQDLNTFFGYPAAIDRTTGVVGPNVIDPQCYYDPDNNRFIVDITTLDCGCRWQLQWQEHDRRRRQQHRRPDRRTGRSTTSRPRTTERMALPITAARRRDDARARASRIIRTSALTNMASTSRPTSTICSDRTITLRRSLPSRRRSSPLTRRRST